MRAGRQAGWQWQPVASQVHNWAQASTSLQCPVLSFFSSHSFNLGDGRVERDRIRSHPAEKQSVVNWAISNSPKNSTHTFTFLKTFRLCRNCALSLMLKVGENCKEDTGLLKQLLFITQKRVATQHLIKHSQIWTGTLQRMTHHLLSPQSGRGGRCSLFLTMQCF